MPKLTNFSLCAILFQEVGGVTKAERIRRALFGAETCIVSSLWR
jgi:hypothetical protein